MKKITQEELDYFLSKINFSSSALDAKAIDIMNRLDTLFRPDDDFVSFLKPLLINGKDELVTLCDKHGVEIDDDNLFRPGSRLMYLGAKVKTDHRYLYLQISENELTEREFTWITDVDNFNETGDKTYTAVNSHHGTAYCINVVCE